MTWNRTAGPKSLAATIVLGVVIMLLLGTSFALAATGHPAWIWVTELLWSD